MKQVFRLVHDTARQRAAQACMTSPDGYVVKFDEPKKSRDQEEKYHAMIGEIHKSGLFCFLGRRDWNGEDIKRLLVEAFANEMAEQGKPLSQSGRIVPSLDMQRTVQLGIQTRKFKKAEASAFVEYLYAYGASLGVEFSDMPAIEAA